MNGTSYDMTLTPSGNLFIAGTLYQYSDSTVKTDIKLIENEFQNIYNLNTYSYKLKEETKSAISENNETILDDTIAKVKHFGFIAQELKNIYPELVFEDSIGKLSVDYTSVIPLLVEALKDQRRDLEELKVQISNLSISAKKSLTSNNETLETGQVSNALYQNAPNPFNEFTTIKYCVANANSASIEIHDFNGKKIKSYNIDQLGEGSITISNTTVNVPNATMRASDYILLNNNFSVPIGKEFSAIPTICY